MDTESGTNGAIDHEYSETTVPGAAAADLLERLKSGTVSIPDEELREIVRNQLQKRLNWGTKTTHEQQLSFNLDFVKYEELREIVRNQLQKRLNWGTKTTHEQQLSFNLDFVKYEELREIVRNQLQKRLNWGTKTTHEQQLSFNLDFVKSLKGTEVTREEQDLYDLPSSFLNMIYGATLKESCSYFKDESMTLDEAEIASHDLYCERAQIQDGQRVLDIGCGQGGFVIHVAQKFKNCHVTGVTNSIAQKKILEKRCSTLELSNVEIILANVSKLVMESTFDRILLIESLEHMKNYELLLRKISKWMKDDGLLFVDYLCHKTFGHNFQRVDEDDDVFSGYLFPGGITIQSTSTLLYFQDNVSVLDHWILSGKHMARTVEELLKNLDRNIEGARDILEDRFKSKEAASQMITYWRTYFIAWNEQFNYNNGDEWMISQILFNKKK